MAADVRVGDAQGRWARSASSSLLEREQEVSRINELLNTARAGAGRVLLVSGPAGIGKTSLLDACAQAADERSMVALRAQGDELVMGSSFAAVRELLWSDVQAAGEGIWAGAARLAASVFEDGDPGGSDDRTASVMHGLYWLVAGLAERAPLALLVDDGQWLDAASARFLVYLARRVDALPVVLAIVTRGTRLPEVPSPLAALHELPAVELRLRPLSEEASATMVRSRLGPRASDALCR